MLHLRLTGRLEAIIILHFSRKTYRHGIKSDGGAGFQEVKYPAVQEIADELGFYPYDTMEKMYCEDGKTYMVVGQGDDGDYVRDGKMMKALYES